MAHSFLSAFTVDTDALGFYLDFPSLMDCGLELLFVRVSCHSNRNETRTMAQGHIVLNVKNAYLKFIRKRKLTMDVLFR